MSEKNSLTIFLDSSPFEIKSNGKGAYEFVSCKPRIHGFNYQWFFDLDTDIKHFQRQLVKAISSECFNESSREWLWLFFRKTEILLEKNYFNKEDACIENVLERKNMGKINLEEKLELLAQTFGYPNATIEVRPCRGKWRGNSDMFVNFNGNNLYIGNGVTKKVKTKTVQNEWLDDALHFYNPMIVKYTIREALASLKVMEEYDSEKALEMGLKPYKLVDVKLQTEGVYLGWYYVVLEIDGKIRNHIERDLNYFIKTRCSRFLINDGKYHLAGGLKNDEVDYIHCGVGFSTKSNLYTIN